MKYTKLDRYVEGADPKFWVVSDSGEQFLVKTGEKNKASPYTEHIASKFLNLLGIDTHHTELGSFDGTSCVFCKDICVEGQLLRPYLDISDSLITPTSRIGFEYSTSHILEILQSEEERDFFFKMLIGDALIGNGDRHGGNWGFLYKYNGERVFAPLYDNEKSFRSQDVRCAIRVPNDSNYPELMKFDKLFSSLRDPLFVYLATGILEKDIKSVALEATTEIPNSLRDLVINYICSRIPILKGALRNRV